MSKSRVINSYPCSTYSRTVLIEGVLVFAGSVGNGTGASPRESMLLPTKIAGPAVVDDVIGAMVKSADVMVAPVEVEVGGPLVVVVAAGVGPPVMVVEVSVGVMVLVAVLAEVSHRPQRQRPGR